MDSTTVRNDVIPKAVAALAGLGAVGAAVMSVAHLGVDVPGFPGPGRMLLPVAIGFAFGAVLFGVVAFGVLRRTRWAWHVAVAVNALAFLSAVVPIRGLFSFVAGGLTLAAVVLLVAPAGRRALLRQR